MVRVLDPHWSFHLVGLSHFDPTQPLYKRQRHEIDPLSHRGLIRLLGMSTLSNTPDLPPFSSSALGGGVPGTHSSFTLWVPRTLTYTNPYTLGPSHLVGMNPFDFTWSMDHMLIFSSRRSSTEN